MRKLFLDDVREPWNDSWDVVRTSSEFKTYIKEMFVKNKKLPAIISFDHDLHKEHYNNAMYGDPVEYNKLYKTFKHETGLECAKWLCNFCIEEGLALPQINVHSANPIGANNIAHAVMNYALFYFEDELILQPKPFNSEEPK